MKSITTYLGIVIGSLFLLFVATGIAEATGSGGFVPLAPIPGTVYRDHGKTECQLGPDNWALGCTSNLSKYLRGLYNTGIALAGFFAVFSIVRGGFTLLFTDSIQGHLEGKKIILQTAGGLIIVFSSFILMNAINPQLAKDLDINLSFPRPTLLKQDDRLLGAYNDIELRERAEQRLISAGTKRLTNDRTAAVEYENSGRDFRNLSALARAEGDPENAAAFAKTADEAEIKAASIRADALMKASYDRGLVWAQRGEEFNLEAAKTERDRINEVASFTTSNILAKEGLEGSLLADEVITLAKDRAVRTAVVSRTIGQQYVGTGLVQNSISQMRKIEEDAQNIVNKLDQMKDESRFSQSVQKLDSAISWIKNTAKGEIDALKRDCLRYNNPTDSPTGGLSCKNYQLAL